MRPRHANSLYRSISRYYTTLEMGLTRRAALKGVLATTVGAVTGGAVYGIGYERHRLQLTEAALDVSGLSPALDGLRIAFLTDIHHSAMVPADDVVHAAGRHSRTTPP